MNRNTRHILLACITALLLAPITALHAAERASPLKVFILAGQSNMEGQAVADLDGKDYNDGKGTLVQLMRDPAKAPLFKHLKDDAGAVDGARRRVGALPARARAVAGRAADDGLLRLWRPASLRPGAAIRPRRGRPLRQPGAAHQDRVGRQEPVQGFPPAEFRRPGRAVLHEDDGGDSRGAGESEDRFPQLRRRRLRTGAASSGIRAGTTAASRRPPCRSTSRTW